MLAVVLVLTGCDPGSWGRRGFELTLRFPVDERERMVDDVMGVDHDPDDYDGLMAVVCENYDGDPWPACYDGHDGTDFTLAGGFEAMDAGSATVVAAADGEVESVVDHHYDRCHLDPDTLDVSCDGHEMVANRVRIRHDNGYATVYKHFMTDSVMVAPGDEVEAGDPLGLVGSSGYSTAPHVHLELVDPDGTRLDPYAGTHSQERSWWCDQYDTDGLPGDCF